MSDVVIALVGALVGVGLGAAGYWINLRITRGGIKAQADLLLQDARAERERVLRTAESESKGILLSMQKEHEQDVRKQREELSGVEKRLRHRETNVERKNELIERRERQLRKRELAVDTDEKRADKLVDDAEKRVQEATLELERVAGLSQDEARQRLLEAVEKRTREEAASRIKRIEDEAKREAHERANQIIATAIQRFAGEFVSEKTVSVVELPSDDMKGRIIGREGRNIRAIEAATGVDVVIDDTPEAVIVSGFNPVRREIAKLALERLVVDGRIHPARIEEVVEKVTEEVEQQVTKVGEQATFDLGLHGVHPELIRLVGKLKFRVVNGQNLWNHAVETGAILGMLSTELGLKPMLAKRAGLLHDIGKAVDHEVDGSHAHVAADLARRYGEKAEVVTAIREHHDAEPSSILGVLLQAADSLSKARPGARREALETYVKRLEDLERISLSFGGVERAYAIQAGTEVRVMVNFEQVTADSSLMLARDIARRIEDELTYPGEVRVTVVREARATDVAR